MKKNEFRIAFVATAFIVFCGWMSGSLWAETTSTVKPEALSAVIARLEERIHQLEQVQDMSARVSREAGGSVGLIVGEYIWTDRTGRKPLRYQEGIDGRIRMPGKL